MEPVNEDWERAVAIVAHPDDLVYGAASAVARWTSQGKEVSYVLATSGEAGIAGMAPDKAGPLREGEQRSSAAVVGVSHVELRLRRAVPEVQPRVVRREPRLRVACPIVRADSSRRA